MSGIVAWLVGSRIGRMIMVGAAITVLSLIACARIFNAGAASEKTRQLEDDLVAISIRKEVDDEIASVTPGVRRSRLREWASVD